MKRFSYLALLAPFAAFAGCSSNSSSNATVVVVADGGDGDAAQGPADAAAASCTAAAEQLLKPIDKIATAEVKVISDVNGVKTLYVDGSGGGPNNASKNPRVYVDLTAGARVDVTDKSAGASMAWDLSFKRTVIFTNSGDGGPGKGGGAVVRKAFDAVTVGDADAAKTVTEAFFDEECNPQLDPIGAPATTFSDWYDYDEATNIPTPKPANTFIVKGGTGKRFKVAITSFAGAADGGTGASTGFFLLKVAPL